MTLAAACIGWGVVFMACALGAYVANDVHYYENARRTYLLSRRAAERRVHPGHRKPPIIKPSRWRNP
jgi:hypothetical protein